MKKSIFIVLSAVPIVLVSCGAILFVGLSRLFTPSFVRSFLDIVDDSTKVLLFILIPLAVLACFWCLAVFIWKDGKGEMLEKSKRFTLYLITSLIVVAPIVVFMNWLCMPFFGLCTYSP